MKVAFVFIVGGIVNLSDGREAMAPFIHPSTPSIHMKVAFVIVVSEIANPSCLTTETIWLTSFTSQHLHVIEGGSESGPSSRNASHS